MLSCQIRSVILRPGEHADSGCPQTLAEFGGRCQKAVPGVWGGWGVGCGGWQ